MFYIKKFQITNGKLDPQKLDEAVAAHGPMMNSQRKRITKCFEEGNDFFYQNSENNFN